VTNQLQQPYSGWEVLPSPPFFRFFYFWARERSPGYLWSITLFDWPNQFCH